MASAPRVALVTGANKGLGFQTAKDLAERGFRVYMGARDAAKGLEAAEALRSKGLDVREIVLDVTSESSVRMAAAEIDRQEGKLDVLVNNAGIGPDIGTPVSAATIQSWRDTFETNVFGLVAVSQAFVPLLKKGTEARVVNLSSILGSIELKGDPKSPIGGTRAFGSAYAASKAAVNMFTVGLAGELEPEGIKVNAAHPGWVQTDLGGADAPMGIENGAKTAVELATLPADGPTGGYFHMGDRLPW